MRIASAQTSGAVSSTASPQTTSARDPHDPPVRIAITFDDLPAHGPLPPGETRIEVATKIIAALHDANMPPTYGFVNSLRIEEQSADAAVLQAWRAAGYPLGNHAWSHMNLNQNSLEAFEADVTHNEPLLAQLMKNEKAGEFQLRLALVPLPVSRRRRHSGKDRRHSRLPRPTRIQIRRRHHELRRLHVERSVRALQGQRR